MIIIGITGTLGAGKGTIVEYLKRRGFKHFSVSNFLIEEVLRRNLTINRDNLVVVANDLRANNSPSYLAEKLYEQAVAAGDNCIIESLRTLGEISSLRRRGNFYLFAVDANRTLRYKRIKLRSSQKDFIFFDQFCEQEKREMSSTDPNRQNLKDCIKQADYIFLNNGTVQELHRLLDETLEEIIVLSANRTS